MEDLSYRVRISALWIMHMVAFVAYRTIAIDEGASEVTVLSNSELASVLLLLMVFAFLTLLLGRGISRLMNIVAGAIFAIAFVAMFTDGITAYPSSPFNLMTGAAVIATASVIWLAARWPKRQPSR